MNNNRFMSLCCILLGVALTSSSSAFAGSSKSSSKSMGDGEKSCRQQARRIAASAPGSDYQCLEDGARRFVVKWNGGRPSDEFFFRTGRILGEFSGTPAPIIEEMARTCREAARSSGQHSLSAVSFTLACRVQSNVTSITVTVDAPSKDGKGGWFDLQPTILQSALLP